MSGLTDVISFDNLNATGENNENGDVNESKDSSVREAVKKSLQKRPNKSDEKGTPSRSKNHDLVKSVEESTSPLGSAKEHARNAADSEWECSLAKINESMGNSGESVDDNTPRIGTPKEHAKTASDSDQEFSLTGNKETITGVSEECSDATGENCDPNDSQSCTVEEKHESRESSNGSDVYHADEGTCYIRCASCDACLSCRHFKCYRWKYWAR